jgi:hypothetical protein
LSESFVNTPMARVSRRRCSKSARLSVGDAFGVEAGAGEGEDGGNGAGDETDCRLWAGAAPATLAGRVSPDDLAFAELERLAGFTGGGAAASEALAGVELRSEPLPVDDPASLGGVATGVGDVDAGVGDVDAGGGVV